jgi:hypothetical protein
MLLSCIAFGAFSTVSFSNLEKNINNKSLHIEASIDFSDNEEFIFNAELEEDDDAKDSFIQLRVIHFTFEHLCDLALNEPLFSCLDEFRKPPRLF